jgi:hypothetical protein
MKPLRRALAAVELALVFPAALFMTALFVRNLQPLQYEPARSAQRIVAWYAARTRIGLWLFLIALPLVVLSTGCFTLLRNWRQDASLRRSTQQAVTIVRANWATLIVALATLAAGSILAIVALHLLTE